MEGIVSRARRSNPAMDIVLLYCVNEHHRDLYLSGVEPDEIAAHRRVARHYGISEVNFAAEIAERIRAGEFDWKRFGGCHPSDFGNDLYGETLDRLLDCAGRSPVADSAESWPSPLPDPIDPLHYGRARFLPLEHAERSDGWNLGTPAWDTLPGSKRGRFRDIPLLHSTTPGPELTLQFSGTALALYVLAGPDAGQVTVSIDGGEQKTVELYLRFSRGLHYPRTVVLADDLGPGSHLGTIRVGPQHHPNSRGFAVRIVGIGVNDVRH
jgi:hypothetical protein